MYMRTRFPQLSRCSGYCLALIIIQIFKWRQKLQIYTEFKPEFLFEGFTGQNCETNVNDCSPSPCPLAATCIDQVDCIYLSGIN